MEKRVDPSRRGALLGVASIPVLNFITGSAKAAPEKLELFNHRYAHGELSGTEHAGRLWKNENGARICGVRFVRSANMFL
jgi:hypothetical protein